MGLSCRLEQPFMCREREQQCGQMIDSLAGTHTQSHTHRQAETCTDVFTYVYTGREELYVNTCTYIHYIYCIVTINSV